MTNTDSTKKPLIQFSANAHANNALFAIQQLPNENESNQRVTAKIAGKSFPPLIGLFSGIMFLVTLLTAFTAMFALLSRFQKGNGKASLPLNKSHLNTRKTAAIVDVESSSNN